MHETTQGKGLVASNYMQHLMNYLTDYRKMLL